MQTITRNRSFLDSHPPGEAHAARSASAASDEHGFVSFFGLSVGEYTLSSGKHGYEIGTSRLVYPTAKTVPGNVRTRGESAERA